MPRAKKPVLIEEETKIADDLSEVALQTAGPRGEALNEEEPITDLWPSGQSPKKSTKKATLKKSTRKVTEKLIVSFVNPYEKEIDDPNDEEQWESDRLNVVLSRNLQDNIYKILEEKTDLEVRNHNSKKEGEIVFELRKSDTSTTPLETDYIKKLVYEHLPHYTEVRERLQRMRHCKIRELDGKFYLFVMSKNEDFGFTNTDELIEMSFSAGDYEAISFSDH